MKVFLPSPIGTHNASSQKKKKKTTHDVAIGSPKESERETFLKISLTANFWCKLLLGYIKEWQKKKKTEKKINELLQTATPYDEKIRFESISHDLIKSIIPSTIREV